VLFTRQSALGICAGSPARFLAGPSPSSKGRAASALVLALAALWPVSLRAAEDQQGGDSLSQSAWTPSLWMTQEYRFRSAGSAESSTADLLGESGTGAVRDQDLRLTLDGNLLSPGGHFTATLSAALWRDLDGRNTQDKQDVFGESRGLDQTVGVLYTASAEWQRLGPLARLAVGRLQANHGLPITFDGGALSLLFLDQRLTLFGFGGRTVHFFETLPGFFENWLVSGGASLRVGPNLKIEVDSRYLHEMILGAGGLPSERVNTNAYGATVMGYWEELRGKVFARGINRGFSHVGGDFNLQVPRAALGIAGQAAAQLVALGEIAESENPYFSMLGLSLPHLRARLETWKDFALGGAGSLVVAVGSRIRQLLHDQPSRFNRNMSALYLRADLNDIPCKGAFVGAAAEWNLPTQADQPTRFFTVGGSAGYTSRTAKIETGSYFQRFKINYYRDVEELEDVRTAYVMGSYRLLSQLEIRARYVAEIVDRNIHSLFLTLREDL
jgi:hypothetical protein